MGTLILAVIVVFWFFLGIVLNSKEKSHTQSEASSSEKSPAPQTRSSRNLPSAPFEVKVSWDDLPGCDEEISVFSCAGKGLISLSPHEGEVRFRLRISSIKDGEKEAPVFCLFGEKGFHEGPFFYEEFMNMPYRNSSSSTFLPLVKVPVSFLIFPHAGRQTLIFEFDLCEVDPRNSISLSAFGGFSFQKKITLDFYNPERGYLEIRDALNDRKENLQLANVKLAVLMARADGAADEDEAAKIKSFTLKVLGKDADTALKRKFNEAVKECFDLPASRISQKISECCREVKEAPLSERLDLLTLLFDVVMSDGRVAGGELDMLEKIAAALDLDREEYVKRRDKALPLAAYEKTISGSVTDRMLGISDDMSDDEIRARLSKVYREWNAKTSAKDEKVRAQAREMIKLISKKRAELSAKR